MIRTPKAKVCPTCDGDVFRLRKSGVCGKCERSSDRVVKLWLETTDAPKPLEEAEVLSEKAPSISELERDIKDNGWMQVHIDKGLKDTYYVTAIGYQRQTGIERAVKVRVSDILIANDLLEKEWQQL